MQRRRVLIANERHERLDRITEIVTELGHEAVGCWVESGGVRALLAREAADVALVGPEPNPEEALSVITALVHAATFPVVAVLETTDPSHIEQVARRGVFACVLHDDTADLKAAIDIALQRFAEYHSLRGAFGRRAVIEQAKGILMAHHAVDADAAFGMLREHSQRSGQKLIDVAHGMVISHKLLSPPTSIPGDSSEGILSNT